MTDKCLQCGGPKEEGELILCPDCADYFDAVQQDVLQEQLDAIKRGMKKNDSRGTYFN